MYQKDFVMLGIPKENIFNSFYTYDLIYRENKEELINKLKDMNFNAQREILLSGADKARVTAYL